MLRSLVGSEMCIRDRIKTLGLTDTRIRLHPEVSVSVIVNIARSLAEAETQLKTGVAVTGEVDDNDQQTASPAETGEDAAASAEGDNTADDADTTSEAADDQS